MAKYVNQGAHAIFAVTDFVELSMLNPSPISAQDNEYLLGKTLADAAAAIPTLRHYIWSTLPSAKTISGGRYNVFHFQGKAAVDEYIIQNLPALAEKTTFLWVGYYANTFAYPPLVPKMDSTTGKHVWRLPVSPDTLVSSIGSPADNVGVFAAAILSQQALTLPAKYVLAAAEKTTQGGMLKKWSNIMEYETEYIEVLIEEFERLFPGWEVFIEMFQFWEEFGEKSWSKEGITPIEGSDLGINNSQLIDIEGTVKKMKCASE